MCTINVVGVTICCPVGVTVLAIVVYIPLNLNVNIFQCFLDSFSNLDCMLPNYILISGDFNVPLFNAGIPETFSALLNNFEEFTNLQYLLRSTMQTNVYLIL